MITLAAPLTVEVDGLDLHVGSVLVDPVTGPHRIEVLDEHPCFLGDHARRAHGDGWHVTVCDHHRYVVEVERQGARDERR